MALTNTLTPEDAERGLVAWLNTQPGVRDAKVTDVAIPSATGLSNETVLFTASWADDEGEHTEQLVARIEPASAGLAPNYDIAKEAQLLRALAASDVVVPAVKYVEGDPAHLGAPFLVMERLPGTVTPDSPSYFVGGWVFDLPPEDKRRVAENAIAQLATVSRVDVTGLEFLARDEPGETPLDREIAYFERWMTWARDGEANPVVDAAFAWVREQRPTETEPVALSWGDSRLGNVLFGDDLRVTGLLDWEFATLASPEMDLGWWLFIERHFLEPHGLERPEGWPSRDETIAIFERHAGREVRHIDFYEVFAGLRFCVMMVRAAALVKSVGAIPADSPMAVNNPGTQALAPLIGAEPPAGIATHVVSNEVA